MKWYLPASLWRRLLTFTVTIPVLVGCGLDEAAKKHAFDTIVEHVLRGRSRMARPTNDSELRTTLVLDLEITEGSAKVRRGGPLDDEEDMDLPVWAGVVPLRLVAGAPEQDPAQTQALPTPVVQGSGRTG